MASSFTEACLHLAWSQWTALGVAGVVAPPDDAVDLEALILFTACIGDLDPRLRDEALDWCIQFGASTVSLSRLRRLASALSSDQQRDFGAFAAVVNRHARLRWPSGSASARAFRPSGKSRLAPVVAPPLIQLRLRRVIGISARVEILLALVFARGFVSARELATFGYAKQNVAAVLDDLRAAHATEVIAKGHQHVHRLTRRSTWTEWMAPLPRSAPPWQLRMPILAALAMFSERAATRTAIVQDVDGLRELERHHRPLRELGLPDSVISPPRFRWSDHAAVLLGALTGPPTDWESFDRVFR